MVRVMAQVQAGSMFQMGRQSIKGTNTLTLIGGANSSHRHVFGRWEETWEPGGNPQGYEQNIVNSI